MPGELVVVGSGIQLGRHASGRVLSEIRTADVVLGLVDPFAWQWLSHLRPDAIPLHPFYGQHKDRRATYREMEAEIMSRVRSGQRVCAVFYGHPGVFADVPHAAMRRARGEGFRATMEAGISAEACLYADLGIDPGERGVQSLEATQFLVFERQLDPTALLILWQVALAGDLSCTTFSADPARLEALVEKLVRWYSPETTVVLYEAARLPVDSPRIDRLQLAELPHARFREYTTLVIPPVRSLEPDHRALAALGMTVQDLA